jgi:hypothetical protein
MLNGHYIGTGTCLTNDTTTEASSEYILLATVLRQDRQQPRTRTIYWISRRPTTNKLDNGNQKEEQRGWETVVWKSHVLDFRRRKGKTQTFKQKMVSHGIIHSTKRGDARRGGPQREVSCKHTSSSWSTIIIKPPDGRLSGHCWTREVDFENCSWYQESVTIGAESIAGYVNSAPERCKICIDNISFLRKESKNVMTDIIEIQLHRAKMARASILFLIELLQNSPGSPSNY